MLLIQRQCVDLHIAYTLVRILAQRSVAATAAATAVAATAAAAACVCEPSGARCCCWPLLSVPGWIVDFVGVEPVFANCLPELVASAASGIAALGQRYSDAGAHRLWGDELRACCCFLDYYSTITVAVTAAAAAAATLASECVCVCVALT